MAFGLKKNAQTYSDLRRLQVFYVSAGESHLPVQTLAHKKALAKQGF